LWAVLTQVSLPAVAVVSKDPGNTTNINLVIAVDLDRDGEITFTKNLKEVKEGSTEATKTDRTSSDSPYRFWINNDYDLVNHNGKIMWNRTKCDDLNPTEFNANDGQFKQVCEQWEEDPTVHAKLKPNAKYPGNRIESYRDLEDFSPMAIRLGVKSIGDDYRLKLTAHGVSISLFQGDWKDGEKAHQYIFDEDKTKSQVETANTEMGFVGALNNEQNIVLNKREVEHYFDDKGVGRFIFEGVEPTVNTCTECYVEVGYYRKGKAAADDVLITSDKVYLELHDVKDFYQEYNAGNAQDLYGDFPAKYIGTMDVREIQEDIFRGIYKTDEINEDYILFVHGWRMRYPEEVAFAETAFKRLYWSGYKGRFGAFTWPTGWYNKPAHIYEPLALIGYLINNVNNYDGSEAVARLVGAKQLFPVLSGLRTKGTYTNLHVIAHSMGNVVVSEALRQHVVENGAAPLVTSYSPSEAATVAGAYYQEDYLIVDHKLVHIPLFMQCNLAKDTMVDAETAWRCYNDAHDSEYAMPPDLYRNDFAIQVGDETLIRHGVTMGPGQSHPTGLPYYHDIEIVAGNMVNFNNARDAALSAWELNQLNKPWKSGFGDYEYKNEAIDALDAEEEYNDCISTPSLSFCEPFTPFVGSEVTSRFTKESNEELSWSKTLSEDSADILAHIVPARTKALGQSSITKPAIQNTTLNFTNSNQDHSAQFHGYYSERRFPDSKRVRMSYWNGILEDSLKLTKSDQYSGLRNGLRDE
jgi:hypothetical protein